MTTILDLDTQRSQYYYDSGYSGTPSPGSSSTSSRMTASPLSQISDTQTNFQLMNIFNTEETFSNDFFNPQKMMAMRDQTAPKTFSAPRLCILEQPVDKFRFRYKSEMHGTHGSLNGAKNEKSKKTYPTVELCGYDGLAVIRCSLYQVDGLQQVPHSHKLVVRNGDVDVCDPHDLYVSKEDGYRAVFQGMGIIHTAKKHIVEELIEKKRREKKFEVNRDLTTREETQIKFSAETEAKSMNLNQVCLGFHAFAVNNDNTWTKLCEPVFSRPINNMKSALTGELKIARLSAAVSNAAGGEDLFLFVEKVGKKNIKVRFFEIDENEEEVWEDWGIFSEADVHHQYAIALRTPPYKNKDIDRSVDVYIQLVRPSDHDRSEQMPFKYKPRDIVTSRKRARTTSSSFSSSELPESIIKEIRNTNYAQPILQEPNTISNEYNRNKVIHDLLREPSDPNAYADFMTGVEINSDDLIDLMDPNFLGDDKLETDGAHSKNPNPIKRASYLAARPKETVLSKQYEESYISDFKQILSIYRKSWLNDPENARNQILEIFANANVNNEDILHNAIENSDTKSMINLLPIIDKMKIYDVLQYKNDRKETCLHIACLFDKPEYIRPLINLGANPNIPNEHGNTALHIAVEENLVICASKILDKSNYTKQSHHLQIDLANDEGLTPLHLAVKKRNLPMVQKLLEMGGASTKLCISKNGNNVLHLAVEQNDKDIVQYLLENTPVKISATNTSGFSSLRLAQLGTGDTSKEIIRLLIKHGAELEKYNSSSNKMDFTWDEVRKDETSSNDDDDDESSLKIDELQRIEFDDECINKLSEHFNKDEKWKLLAKHLQLENNIIVWKLLGNPTECILNFVKSSDEFNLDIFMDALRKLNANEAIECVQEMIKRTECKESMKTEK